MLFLKNALHRVYHHQKTPIPVELFFFKEKPGISNLLDIVLQMLFHYRIISQKT